MKEAAGGGMVKVRMNGARQVRRVTIDPEAVRSGDVELLEDLVKAAINDASRKIEQQMQEKAWFASTNPDSSAGGR